MLPALILMSDTAGTCSAGPHRSQPISMVVIHATDGPTCNPKTDKVMWVMLGTVAANMRCIGTHCKLGIHDMGDRDGTLLRSVAQDQVAHRVFRNSARSIAVELINDGDGIHPYPEAQLSEVTALIEDIAKRRRVTPQGIQKHLDLDFGGCRVTEAGVARSTLALRFRSTRCSTWPLQPSKRCTHEAVVCSATVSRIRGAVLKRMRTRKDCARQKHGMFLQGNQHMASNQDFINYVCEQVGLAERVTYKRMFGEYALYVDGKVVAFVCDNQLFVKPTVLGKQFVGNIAEAPPYPGAKLYFLLSERLDDRDLMRQLFLITANELPMPKPKSKPKVKPTVPAKKPSKLKI